MPDRLPEVIFHVYPADCDMLGHVNHATMLAFLERARWELLERQDAGGVRDFARVPVWSVVRHVDIDYFAQSLPGDDLAIRSGLLAVKNTSYIVKQDVRKVGTGAMIALLPNGIELAHDEMGSGVPLLFVHGWPHNRALWSAQLRGLSALARCIAPDLRGFGASSVMGPYTIDQYADDLAALLASRHVERAVVCGLSMGGYVALAMLRRHRQLLRGLILTSTRATADSSEARAKRLSMITFVEEHGVEALAANQLKAMVGDTTFTSRPDLLESLRRHMAVAPRDGVVGALHAMAERADATALLATIDIPTLVVSGAEDTITPPVELRALAHAIPGATLQTIEGAGHLCAYERPAAFNHLVGEFLTRLTCD